MALPFQVHGPAFCCSGRGLTCQHELRTEAYLTKQCLEVLEAGFSHEAWLLFMVEDLTTPNSSVNSCLACPAKQC